MPPLGRRAFISSLLATAASAQVSSRASSSRLTMPGPFPGRVVSARHTGSYRDGKFQAEPIRAMLHKGMLELTGAPDWPSAWRVFFEPGDVVGIKLNPVGRPGVISSPEVFHEILDGLQQAGVKARDIIAYDRYREEFLQAGFDKWLPEGVRWTHAAQRYDPVQLGMDGYDPDHYMETPLTQPGQDPRDPHARRSYVAKFLTQQVNKVVNLAVLKHHQSAGVTLALKNLSYGMVNNVARSHSTPTLNTCGSFIPAVANTPVIREKVVLHILDGVLGLWHGGPGGRQGKYVWPHHTLYLASDPVALDRTGWLAIDEQRVRMGMAPVAFSKPDADSHYLNCQPEHIEIAGALGLGVFDEKKIERKEFQLG